MRKLQSLILFLGLGLILPTISLGQNQADKAQEIVDAAIEVHGSEKLRHSVVEFVFRDHQYHVTRDGWKFETIRRSTNKEGQQVKDTHNRSGISREINGRKVVLDERTRGTIETELNSVVYFAYLPLKLNDKAVNKSYAGVGNIDGRSFHRIEVTFDQEGGGQDFEDTFMYWFDTETKEMSYLGYKFHVNDGGTRFRVRQNRRIVDGVIFADFINYKGDPDMSLLNFEDGANRTDDKKLSTIILERVEFTTTK